MKLFKDFGLTRASLGSRRSNLEPRYKNNMGQAHNSTFILINTHSDDDSLMISRDTVCKEEGCVRRMTCSQHFISPQRHGAGAWILVLPRMHRRHVSGCAVGGIGGELLLG